MENNLDSPAFGNFGIENTMEMGLGNAQLLNDLMGADTATSSPDDIKDINDIDVPEKKTPTAPAKKAAATTTNDTPADSKDEEDKSKSIQDFLLGGDDDDEEDDSDAPPANTKVKKVGEESNNADIEDSDEDSVAETQFAALAKDLLKLGVFSQDDDDDEAEAITTPEQFLERFNAEKKKGAIEVVNNFIGQFGEDYQQAFDAIFVKGVDPKEYFGTYGNIQSFSEMDLAQEANQVSVITQALTDQGFDPEDITSEVERLKNYGDLESVATKHHKVLVKKESAKLQQMEQKRGQELQQQAAVKQQYYQNVQSVLQDKLKAKEFDGIPLNPKLVGELQDFLLTDKYKTNSGETLTDFDKTILELKRPENHEKKVKLGLLLKILEKDPTLSTIQKTGVTKKSNTLFDEVVRQSSKSSVKSSKPTTPSSWFN
jgi:hypothetical protein